jgi:hypothetical protein
VGVLPGNSLRVRSRPLTLPLTSPLFGSTGKRASSRTWALEDSDWTFLAALKRHLSYLRLHYSIANSPLTLSASRFTLAIMPSTTLTRTGASIAASGRRSLGLARLPGTKHSNCQSTVISPPRHQDATFVISRQAAAELFATRRSPIPIPRPPYSVTWVA